MASNSGISFPQGRRARYDPKTVSQYAGLLGLRAKTSRAGSDGRAVDSRIMGLRPLPACLCSRAERYEADPDAYGQLSEFCHTSTSPGILSAKTLLLYHTLARHKSVFATWIVCVLQAWKRIIKAKLSEKSEAMG